ncbi:phage integrase Arm DNA-binding domain-containing protein [Vibrio sp. DNB22_17_1]
MMKGRPRTHRLNVANLYCKLDKRSGTVYYQYRDQRTGRFRGLGNDKSRAIAVAKELNELILKQLVDQYSHLLDSNPVRVEHKGISTKAWCERYLEIQFERLEDEEITIHTVKTRKTAVKVLIERCQTIGIKELDTKTLATILDEYKKARKHRMAQVLRSVWIDVYKEAQQAGEVSSGYNPALATKNPKAKVQRARLAESDWQPIFESACKNEPKYTSHAMMISLTTSLRREDVCAIEFAHIKNGHLHVATSKSGGETKLAFPLSWINHLRN